MMTTVPGILKEGKIELLETPRGVKEGRVRVTLVEEEEPRPAPRYLVPGKYQMNRFSTLEDFSEAEWRSEPEFDDLDSR